MENIAPSNWGRFKLLLWKNKRVYFSQKSSMAWEFFPAVCIGIALLFFRGLLQQPHYSEAKIYPEFSPSFLPLGKVPDIDAIFHSNRSGHRASPVTEGICEMVRRGQSDPEKLSIRSIMNIVHKLKDVDPSQIDFKRPEIINLLNNFDLSAVVAHFGSRLINDEVRDMLHFLMALSSADDLQDNLIDAITDILQAHRHDIISKIEEFKNKSASADSSLKRWIVLWSPVSNKVLSSIMAEASALTPFITCGLESSSLLQDALTRPLPFSQEFFTLAGVSFPDSLQQANDLPEHLPITLRFPGLSRFMYDQKLEKNVEAYTTPLRTNWETMNVFPSNPAPGPRNSNEPEGGSPGYYREGFLGLQSSISEAITRHFNQSQGGNMPPLQVRLKRFPNPPAYNDPDGHIMMLVVMVSCNGFLAHVIATVRRIVSEKESHLKEILRILGVDRWLQWAAWFFPTLLGFLIISSFLAVIFKINIFGKTVFPFSDGLYVLGVFSVFSVEVVALCFFISAFFSTAANASAAAGAIWAFLNIVFAQCEFRSVKLVYKYRLLLSLLPNCAILYALKTIWSLESTGLGLHGETFDYTLPDSEDIPVSTLVCVMLFESIFLLVATLYREAINPGPLGIPLPWYFPFTRRFWFGGRKKPYVELGSNDDHIFLEPEPANISAGIQIRGLRKVFSNGKIGVQSLTLNIFEGQITVLLGHNGAGKTTTMSMLTGMSAPTAGTALVANHDLVQNLQDVRKNLGICPQGNLLLDDLTVNEHLYFFCKLKGLPESVVSEETSKYVKILQLEPKANVLAKNLSGGMKRKLGAALALCGGTKVVLLDEPTSGMDPTARRALWDLLKAEKTGRTILLTTHFMDEADFLGDRIAIMSEGRLRAAGSSFFLKKKYGGGYRLVLVKNPDCKSNQIMKLIENFHPGISPLSDVGSELSFQLPENKASEFPSLFQAIEKNREIYGINSFGITSASIDEVFMNVISNSHRRVSTKIDHTPDDSPESYSNETCVLLGIEPPLTGCSLLFCQFQALYAKHWIIFTRSPLAHIFALISPALNAMFAVFTSSQWQGTKDPVPRYFSFKDYRNGYAAVFGENNQILENFAKIVQSDGGLIKNLTASDSVEAILEFCAVNPLTSQSNFITALDAQSENITAFFNNGPFHSAPLALQLAYNSFLNANGANIRLDFVNHPLPFTGIMKTIIQQNGMNTSFHLAYQGAIIFLMLTAWLMVSHIREKITGSKLLQFMAGVNPVVYWAVAFVWDMMICIFAVLLFAWVPYSYQEEGFATIEDASKLIIVGISFFVVAVMISFLFSHIDWEASKSFLYFSMLGYLCGAFGFILLTAVRIHKLLPNSSTDWLAGVFTWSPYFAIAESIQNINLFYWLRTFCEPINQKFCIMENVQHICCKDPMHCPEEGCKYWTDDFLDMTPPGVGFALRINFIVAMIAGFLLFLIETSTFQKIRHYLNKSSVSTWKPVDEDVYREWQLVRSVSPSQRKSCNLLVSELSKNYGNFQAVKNLSLVIPAGECFGLLGVNGAGKTTTFRMLTGDLEPTSGDAYVNGFSMRYNRKQIHQLVGYCPQFDALLEEFTGRETLRLFCKLRGIPDSEVELTCEKLARDLLFYPHIDHAVKNYSGGNKRKLSTAIALVGDPSVVFLDEPTTGMDPVAKRYFWEVISNLRNSGKTIILTSHSMEECEALCTRVGIMVSGELLCLGSPQHLKTKFAQGHCLTVKIGNPQRRKQVNAKNVLDFIKEKIPGAVLNEQHDGVHTFHISPSSSPWSEMFKTLEAARSENQIEDYYLGQTSLEEVFLSIAARDQKSN